MAILTGNMQNGMPQPPSRSVSFQKMLDLEKKYKLERLQTTAYPPPVHRAHHPSLTSNSSASSPRSDSYPTQPSPPPESQPQPQPQAQPNSSFSQEQNMVLLQAVRRSVALPSLSISIPPHPNISKSTEAAKPAKPVKPATKAPPPKSESRNEPRSESRAEQSKDVAKATKETKTVTFVAPDDGDLSDEQSICQSPTWEGYKEAEKKKKEGKKQKKKEKEQAAKDAKVAKKRLTARLSKVPPPGHPASKELTAASRGRKTPHRSAIDLPLAIQYRPHDDENPGDAQHALAKLTGQPYHPVGRRPPSRDDGFVGGVKLAREREEMEMRLAEIRQKVKQNSHGDQSKKPRAQKAISLDPSALPQAGPKTSTASLEAFKKEREISRPPLSMHPIFRHNRSNSTTTIDIATNADAPANGSTPALVSQNSGPSPDSRGRPGSSGSSTGYVRSSRAQSSERAISGFRDEYKVGFFARLRGSSQPPKERVKAPDSPKTSTESYRRNAQLPATPATPARKPARPKAAPPAVQANSPSQSIGGTVGTAVDCPPPPRISSPAGSDASSSRTSLNQFAQSQQLHAVNRPVSPTFSFTSNMTSYFEHHPIDGSLRGSPESKPSTSTLTGTPSSSMFHLPEVIKTPSLTSQFNQATLFSLPARATQSTGTINLTVTKMDSQPESRASERSSSSSYAGSHEVSTPVSPVSTPDTSRPQSQKGGAPVFGEVSKGSTASLVVETDQRAIRNSSHGVTISTNGNQDDTKSKRSKPLSDSEDASGRSTLPIDINQESAQMGLSKSDRGDTPSPSRSSHAPNRPPLSTTSSMSSHYEEAQEAIVPSPERRGTLPSPSPPTLRPQSQPPSPKITHMDDKTASRPGSDISFLPPLKHQSLVPPNKGKAPAPQQKPESRIFPVISTPKSDRPRSMSPTPPMVSKTETPRSDDSELSGPASYLQEARKTTPAPAPNALKVMRPSNLRQSAVASMTPMPDKPFAKMFVECCSCRFYHDMPSKVYECMVNPDSFVEDRRLGVSGAITTMVKCPWCGHNMSKDCCAGYMAMVTLKEKLH